MTFTDIYSSQFKMKRNPRKLKWTKAFRKSAGKEMVVDSTLTFAARRNVPVRYNRELVEKTLKAMERVSEIRQKRERVFYKKRMAGNKEREREANRKLVAENEHLLPKMKASERKALEEANEDVEEVPLQKEKTKVFGKMQQRRKVLVDGGVEDDMDMD
jgi:large subunit ribosomal protein L24e